VLASVNAAEAQQQRKAWMFVSDDGGLTAGWASMGSYTVSP